MARGGKRAGKPGTAYRNRTDMNLPVQAAPGGQYGSVKASEDAQKVIPLRNAQAQQVVAQPQQPMEPGAIPFDAPTERPNEPVTAGLPMGEGPGPEVLNLPTDQANISMQLRAIYANIPAAQNNDFLRLIELAEQDQW